MTFLNVSKAINGQVSLNYQIFYWELLQYLLNSHTRIIGWNIHVIVTDELSRIKSMSKGGEDTLQGISLDNAGFDGEVTEMVFFGALNC